MNYSFSFFRRFGWMIAAVVLLLPGRGQSPAAEPQLSQAELETLLGPIALYPDPLLSIVLPAACYPLEIVEAARFVANSNNIPKIDDQSWDVNVKSVAKIPAALKKLNDDLSWTSKLGQAFLNQQKDVMDTVQVLRKKAEAAGTLKTSEQQIVIVTNMVTEKTIESQVVVVTNTIVQIAPANPQIVYVPQYVPQAVYYPPPTYNPLAPLITFGAGIAVGAIIANNCDWHYGGVYVGGGWGYHGGTYVNNNVNININNNNINNINNIILPTGPGAMNLGISASRSDFARMEIPIWALWVEFRSSRRRVFRCFRTAPWRPAPRLGSSAMAPWNQVTEIRLDARSS
ncbi:MAG TPA: hypothetical protein DCE44_21425 [Verrucomicrobiales bacterium]|nr:hypothetical protein [Verrucomicrobiales bacterium]